MSRFNTGSSRQWIGLVWRYTVAGETDTFRDSPQRYCRHAGSLLARWWMIDITSVIVGSLTCSNSDGILADHSHATAA